MPSTKITTVSDIEKFEDNLAAIFWQKLKNKIPVMILDSRKQESATEVQNYQVKSLEAETALLGFDPNDKKAVMEQYFQGKISQVSFPLEPLIFPQDKKAPAAVPYLKVTVSAQQSDDNELQHFLTDRTRNH